MGFVSPQRYVEPVPAASTSRADIVAASAATAAKVLSWAVAAAVVYRQLGEAAFAVLAMTRATLGLLNYTTFGLGPALTRMVAEAERSAETPPSRGPTDRRSDDADAATSHGFHSQVQSEANVSATTDAQAERSLQDVITAVLTDSSDQRSVGPRLGATHPLTLDYASSRPFNENSAASLLSTTARLLVGSGLAALVLAWVYASYFHRLHEVPVDAVVPDSGELVLFVFTLGAGFVARLGSDAISGASHALGRLRHDQTAAAATDVLWIALLTGGVFAGSLAVMGLALVGMTFMLTGGVGLAVRFWLSRSVALRASFGREKASSSAAFRLLAYGGLVTLGSAADFLYAPIDYFILNHKVSALAPAVYAPAVQIDAAILVLVSAVATVALPKAARLAAAGDNAAVWRGYLTGSILAGGAALALAIPAWLLSPHVFSLWLGDDLPATRAMLPLILLHTILGSAAGVGRATLVAVGYARSYAVVVLLGGAINVALSLWFVHLGWGIAGVIWGTIISVAARCLVALPLLVRRATR